MKMTSPFRLGIDIGSTSLKGVLINSEGNVVLSKYKRHQADIFPSFLELLKEIYDLSPDLQLKYTITGSIGMGIAEILKCNFKQEVIAAIKFIKEKYPETSTFIDIGGEDAKLILFKNNLQPDIRMNGSCAGGTGAFIDQMSTLLSIPIEELNDYAEKAETIYPIASRCGVFSKTDIQNLVSRNVSKYDIAGSIFHAVALQVISSLSRGYSITPKIFFCGAPFAFLPELKKAFLQFLQISEQDVINTNNPELVPAYGTALSIEEDCEIFNIKDLLDKAESSFNLKKIKFKNNALSPLFESEEHFKQWNDNQIKAYVSKSDTITVTDKLFLGVDSGSTTTKIVVLNENKEIVFQYYCKNKGDAISAFKNGIIAFKEKYHLLDKNLVFQSSAITGYGENLIKAAFNIHFGIVETMAHFLASRFLFPNVSFIFDIGGQDMKAIYIENGSIKQMEINEACSSGCGSFIESFAAMLGMDVSDFAALACQAPYPSDLGTRCTVFMNSKVKQTLREGDSIANIAAGLSYSVIKNCLYKVLKIKNLNDLGNTIVVQGGTFKNPSIRRCLEILTGKEVYISNIPELMGAFGAALFAHSRLTLNQYYLSVEDILKIDISESSNIKCKGCDNRCNVKKFTFSNFNNYYSGNKCERIFSNQALEEVQGENFHEKKYNLLFNRDIKLKKARLTIGIPRGLIIYEDYPFWHTLLTECNIQPLISGVTTVAQYEKGAETIMADNICFPAKLMHGHIMYLIKKNVDRILYPYNVYEKKEIDSDVNSYNCPIVTGYSDVLKSSIDTEDQYNIPIDAPVLNFNDKSLLTKSLINYLSQFGCSNKEIKHAIEKAIMEQNAFEKSVADGNFEFYNRAMANNMPVIVLAGRPYHIDPLIQHKISSAAASMGATVLTEDIVKAFYHISNFEKTEAVAQWAFPNRIMNCARWVATQPANVHFVQITSFGCGPDAFINEDIRKILNTGGKNLTLLKVDDVNNIGSLRLRIRSLLESNKEIKEVSSKKIARTPSFKTSDKHRKILAPYFAEGYSDLLPSVFKIMNIELETLPPSDISSNEFGLLFANNEICYPATLVVGDIMKALTSEQYDPSKVAVAITQTGGQCRATNYISIIKKALIDGGFTDIPVVSISFGNGIINDQPGFVLEWSKCIGIAYTSMLYVDALSKLYYPAAVRENKKGEAALLRAKYLEAAKPFIEKKDKKGLYKLLANAVSDFTDAIDTGKDAPKIGVVGEIYVKYNSFSHKNIVDWLISKGIEVVAPSMFNFMMAEFVNNQIKKEKNMSRLSLPLFIYNAIFNFAQKYSKKIDNICKDYQFYRPFSNLEKDAKNASQILNLAAQFGEGWLIPAEIAGFADQNINNAISIQPFGCIANHIISKGIEKKIKKTYPKMNLLFLDFDGGTSEANVLNRIYFMIENCQKEHEKEINY